MMLVIFSVIYFCVGVFITLVKNVFYVSEEVLLWILSFFK